MRDHEDLSAFEALILAILLEDETAGEEVTTKELGADTTPVGTHGARHDRGHEGA